MRRYFFLFRKASFVMLSLLILLATGCNSNSGSGAKNADKVRFCYVTDEYSGSQETHVEKYSFVAGGYRLVEYDTYTLSYIFDEESGLLQKVVVKDVMENGVVNSTFTAICDAKGHMIRGAAQIDGKEVVRVFCSYNDAGNLDYSEWIEGEGDSQHSISDSFFWSEDGKDLISITHPSAAVTDFYEPQKCKGADLPYRCPVVMAPLLSSMGWEFLTQVLFGAGLLGPWFEENVILRCSQFFEGEDEPIYESLSEYEYGHSGIETIITTSRSKPAIVTNSKTKTTLEWK